MHWNGPAMKTSGIDSEMRKVRGIQDFHIDTRRWSDVAYSFLVGQSGTFYEGRGWDWDQFANGDDEIAPYTEKGNKLWRSVCWLGGEGQEPSSEVVRGITELIHFSRVEKNVGLEVHPHLDWQLKPCPGPRLTQLCRTLNNWPIPLGDAVDPVPPPAIPSTEEDDMLTAIRAKGQPDIYLTDGYHRWYVNNGDHFDRSCFIRAIRFDGQDEVGQYRPFEVSPEYVSWLVPMT